MSEVILDPEEMRAEKLTLDDIKMLYGDIGVQVANLLGIQDREITLPQLYRAFAGYLLAYSSSYGGKDLYERNLRMFNHDVIRRFPHYIEFTRILDRQFHSNNFVNVIKRSFPSGQHQMIIKSEYENPFENRYLFSKESYLNKTLFDYLSNHDMVFAQREKNLAKGKGDIVLDFGKKKSIIELKKSKAKNKDLYQVFDYVQADESYQEAILIAASFDEYQKDLAEKLDISLVSYQVGRNDAETEFLLILKQENYIHNNGYFNDFFKNELDESDDVVSIWFEHPLFDNSMEIDKKYRQEAIVAIDVYNELIQKGGEVYGR